MIWLPRAAAIMVAVIAVLACASRDDHFGPGLVLREATYPEERHAPEPMTARQALAFALRSLQRRGVRDVRLCRLDWIAAPLGAAVVQATGRWENGGAHFEAFGLVIYDGTEIKYGHPAGEESIVLARGIDQKGMETYYASLEKGLDPRVFHLEELEEVDRELMFEFISREALAQLPASCGIDPRKDLH